MYVWPVAGVITGVQAFVSSGFDYCGGATNGAWASGDCLTDPQRLEQSPIVLPPVLRLLNPKTIAVPLNAKLHFFLFR